MGYVGDYRCVGLLRDAALLRQRHRHIRVEASSLASCPSRKYKLKGTGKQPDKALHPTAYSPAFRSFLATLHRRRVKRSLGRRAAPDAFPTFANHTRKRWNEMKETKYERK